MTLNRIIKLTHTPTTLMDKIYTGQESTPGNEEDDSYTEKCLMGKEVVSHPINILYCGCKRLHQITCHNEKKCFGLRIHV